MLKNLSILTVAAALLALPLSSVAAENKASDKDAKLKPYPLKTCLVSNEKLGSMGAPYVHKYKDREVKFCCKGCLKDFNKNTDKYVKQLEEAEKKADKK